MATLPKDAAQLFDELIPKALAEHPDKAREVNAIYYFDISGDGGGQWTVDLTSSPPAVTKGKNGDAQCSIGVAHSDFMDMLKDPQVGMQLYFGGKLTVEGDPTLAMKLQEVFEMGQA